MLTDELENTEALFIKGHTLQELPEPERLYAVFDGWYTCHCGDSYVSDYTAALGHSWNEGVVIVEPTEEAEGEKLCTCTACGETKSETIPVLDHVHECKETITEPTCTEQGYTTFICRCGDSYVADYVDALGHTHEAFITEPTCTEEGYTTYTCHCGDVYVSDYTQALGHDLGTWYTVSEATCTEDGLMRRDCKRCDYSVENVIPAKGHEYEGVVTNPTCTEQGYTTYTCHCGDTYVADYVEPHGHSFDEWYTIAEPTCTESGLQQRNCAACLHSETAVLDATGHTLVFHEAQEPTCTAIGWNKYEACENCDYTTYEELPTLDHSYTAVITPPSCTKQGFTTYTCHCGESYVADYVETVEHTFDEWCPSHEPTCTDDVEERRYCIICGYCETRIIPAPGHNYQDGKCTVCGEKDPDAITIGDVNRDGQINTADYVLVKRAVLKTYVLNEEQKAARCNQRSRLHAVKTYRSWHLQAKRLICDDGHRLLPMAITFAEKQQL